MRKWVFWVPVALLLVAGNGLAEPPGGEEEEFDLAAALKKVTQLMRQSEKHLTEAQRAGSNAGEEARKKIDELLRQSRDSGTKASDVLGEILEKAPVNQGQGQGQEQKQPDEEEQRRKREQEKEARDREDQDGQKPRDAEENPSEPNETTARPPDADTDEPSRPDPDEDWLGRLPEQIRQDVKNGEFDRIPARFRELLQKYFKKVAEVESER